MFSIAITSFSLLSLLIGTFGVTNLIQNITRDSLKNRYFATRNFTDNNSTVSDGLHTYIKPNDDFPELNLKPVNSFLSQEDSHPYWFEERNNILEGKTATFRLPSVNSKDEIFLKDLLSNGYSLEDYYDGALPIILQDNLLMQLENYQPVGTNQEVYKFLQVARQKYLGKTFTLSRFEVKNSLDYFQSIIDQNKLWLDVLKPINTKVIVVGFGLSSVAENNSNILMPNWAFEKLMSQDIKFANPLNYTFYYEYSDKSSRDRAVLESIEKYTTTTTTTTQSTSGNTLTGTVYNNSTLQPLPGRSEYLENIIFSFQQVLLVLSGFLLVVSCVLLISYLSRIILESRQEIGIMRAVGAKKIHIIEIYTIYVWLISSIGFAIGFSLSICFNAIASLFWGDFIYYSFLPFATTTSPVKPTFIFLGYAGLPVLAVYFIFNVILFLVSFPSIIKATKIDPIRAIRES